MGMQATREEYARLNKHLAELGKPRVYKAVQPAQLSPRRRADRTRHGISAARALRLRFNRGEFGERELRRRIAQAWASV